MEDGEYWGERAFRWPERTTAGLHLPASAIDYLAGTGLPRRVSHHLMFEPPDPAPPRIAGRPELIQIGWDTETLPVCLDESRGGEALAWDPEEPPRRFMNSSVVRLGAFLVVYDRIGPAYAAADDSELERLAASAEAELRAIDARAFSSSENYWPVVLELIRTGMI